MNNMMHCLYYLCHEEAAIIKVCVEVLQFRVMGYFVWDRLCVNICGTILFNVFSLIVFTPTHILSHTLCLHCIFTTVVSIMFILALLKNQNKNKIWRWTGIEKPVTDVSYLKTWRNDQFLWSKQQQTRYILTSLQSDLSQASL